MTSPEVAFVPATVLLRPPRVAIMVADDEHWRDWAMRALTVASDYWGGGGFILVPYDRATGTPSPHFAEVVRAYDPDHVVTLEFSYAEYEDLYPGFITFDNVDDEEERVRIIRNAHGEVDDPAGRRARAIAATWCSPMRIRPSRDEGTRRHETIVKLREADRSDRYQRGLTVAVLPSPNQRFAASTRWRSDAGMIAAARVGVATADPHDRPEPGFEVLGWTIAPTTDAPDSLLWSTAHPGQSVEQPDWWFRAGQGLIQISRGHLRDRAAVVVGDTGTDFALALAYDRIIGRGIWFTPALLDDDDAFKSRIRPAVWTLMSELEQNASNLAVCSTSATTRQIARVTERLQKPDYEFERVGIRRQREAGRETVQTRFANVERGLLEYVIEEHLGTSVMLPMAEEEDGTLNAMTGLEAPVPSNLMYRVGSGKVPYWYVDVTLARDNAPRARDFPASGLTIEDGPFPQVNLRPSNDGVTFDPSSMGFVPGGALLPGRLGRPRLRSLSMRTWVEGMAELHGLGVRLSTPGRQAELVRRRLGSRRALFDLIGSPSLAMLRAFIPLKRPPEERHPDTVVLGLDPYLSWEAIDALLPGEEGETVKTIDTLTSARLLRRGLIVNCVECGRPSFLDADKMGQQYECPQCASMNTLVSERWRKGREARWFYDLYATFRELLAKHGEVPILASAALSAKTVRGYADTPELEFYELDGGKRVAEIDVVASTDREVVIVEAKSTDAFPHGKRAEQTVKLLRVAAVLRADRIVLATTESQWKQTDVEHVTREAGRVSPFPLRTEVLAGLGAPPAAS